MQGEAWNALRTQEVIDQWANVLHTLVNILEPLGEALDFLALLVPSRRCRRPLQVLRTR